jgi:hypothetical protein
MGYRRILALSSLCHATRQSRPNITIASIAADPASCCFIGNSTYQWGNARQIM